MQMKKVCDDTAIMKTGETTLAQYCVAVYNSAAEGQVKRPTATSEDKIFGVLRTAGHAAGTSAEYDCMGKTKVMIASSVSISDQLCISDVQGRVRTWNEATDKALPILGTAETANTAAGSLIICVLQINNAVHS
jgi:hypothetical protein